MLTVMGDKAGGTPPGDGPPPTEYVMRIVPDAKLPNSSLPVVGGTPKRNDCPAIWLNPASNSKVANPAAETVMGLELVVFVPSVTDIVLVPAVTNVKPDPENDATPALSTGKLKGLPEV